jgi:hypothetical protein
MLTFERKGLGWLLLPEAGAQTFIFFYFSFFHFFTNTRLPRGAILSAGLAFVRPL